MVNITQEANQPPKLGLPIELAAQLGKTALAVTRSAAIRTWSILAFVPSQEAESA